MQNKKSRNIKNKLFATKYGSQTRRKGMELSDLKNFDVNRLEINELIALSAFAQTLHQAYEVHQVPEPEWFQLSIKALRREIKSRRLDSLESELRAKKARLETLKPAEEKRTSLADEIKQLEEQLQSA
jgi:ABC-type uncharacterized transport system involved in gliding motility auxiliary subunit